MSAVILLVVAVGALAQCGLSAPLALRVNYTNAIVGFTLKQRIAFRIGQVECLKTLLSEGEYRNAQYGLGSLHRGNYSRDITRFDVKQRIAFLLGQVQCLKIHASLEGNKSSPVEVTTQPPPTPASPTTEGTAPPVSCIEYLDCKDAYLKSQTTSGIYTIKPDNQTAFQVYCDMDTNGGGWIVFQRRMDGSVGFYRNWTDYEQGFGNLSGEHWLGLRKIHRLIPNNASQELRVDLEDFSGNTRYAHYQTFSVAGTSDNYRLLVSGYNGTAGDALAYHSGYQFTTYDQDNDAWGSNCAVSYRGAWWYKSCYRTNLNGVYYQYARSNCYAIRWNTWNLYAKKITEMKLRRK